MGPAPFSLAVAIDALIVVVTVAVRAATVNRLVKRKLPLSLLLAGASVIVSFGLRFGDAARLGGRVRRTASRCCCRRWRPSTSLVAITINPLRVNRVPEQLSRTSSRTRSSSGCSRRCRSSSCGRRCSPRRPSAPSSSASRCRTRSATPSPGSPSRSRSRSGSGSGSGWASTRACVDRDHLARDQAADQGRHVRRRAQQRHVEGGHRQLLGARAADARRRRGGRDLRQAAERGEGGHPRGHRERAARAERARSPPSC